MAIKRRAIVWFRQDLRLGDNEALTEALSHAYEVLPVYVFDIRLFKEKDDLGFPVIGPYRSRFILESVKDLQRSLKRLGSDLIVRIGKPEEEILKIARSVRSSWVFCNRERTPKEVAVQDTLEQNLWSVGQELRYSRGKMLYHTGDLPFPIQHTPDTFGQFKKEVERYVNIREPLERPQKSFNFLMVDVDPGIMPALKDLGYPDFKVDSRLDFSFKGGESHGLERLKNFIWESGGIEDYKDGKDELSGLNATTKLSPYLAQGCISPKQVYAEIKRYEDKYGANKSTEALFVNLMYRDFHRLMVKKHGNAVFDKGGFQGETDSGLSDDPNKFSVWQKGNTGVPLIDAAMQELNQTGYISNRARQNVASYLVHEMKVNWQYGAAYFESMLIDYDVCSNWVNWNIVAGISTDPREDIKLNHEAQTIKYDPQHEYIDTWLQGISNSKENNTALFETTAD
ncbi:MAG: DASH family cryptochrome [Saprospiraceae bacterium]